MRQAGGPREKKRKKGGNWKVKMDILLLLLSLICIYSSYLSSFHHLYPSIMYLSLPSHTIPSHLPIYLSIHLSITHFLFSFALLSRAAAPVHSSFLPFPFFQNFLLSRLICCRPVHYPFAIVARHPVEWKAMKRGKDV